MDINVTGVDMVKLVKKAFDLSRPQGMGFIQADKSPLTDEEAKSLIEEDGSIDLDYVKGRACKFHVRVVDGKSYISAPWYDHSDQDLVTLFSHVGIIYLPGDQSHNISCNCDLCRFKQGKGPVSPSDPVGKIKIVPVE